MKPKIRGKSGPPPSPISWTHHWVWAEPALLVLAVLAWRHSWRAGLAAVAAWLVTFAVSPAWLLPSGHDTGPRWLEGAGLLMVAPALGKAFDDYN